MASTILSCVQTKYGAGHHESEASLDAAQMNIKLSFVDLLFYTVCAAMTKISICLFCLRIFHPGLRGRFLIYACISFTFLILNVFQCTPIQTFQDVTLRINGGKCIDTTPVLYTAASCNIISEI